MAIAKPSIVPLWGLVDPVIETPPTDKQNNGWADDDIAPEGWLNYLFVPLSEWAQFWNEKVAYNTGTKVLTLDPTSVTEFDVSALTVSGALAAASLNVTTTLTVGGQATFTANVANTATILSSGPVSGKSLYMSAQNGSETIDGVFKLINAGTNGMLEPVLWTNAASMQAVYFNRTLFRDQSQPSKTLSTTASTYSTTSYSLPGNTARVGGMFRIRCSAKYTPPSSTAHTVTLTCFGFGANSNIAFAIPATTNPIVLDCEFVFIFTAIGASGGVRTCSIGSGCDSAGANAVAGGDASSGAGVDTTTSQTISLNAKTSSSTGTLVVNDFYIEAL